MSNGKLKHYVFDYLNTSDGYEVGWLHEIGQKDIEDPDSELFYDKYGMMSVAKELILEGNEFDNYWLDEEDILEWIDERDRCKECEGEGSIISPTYDDPYNEEPCPECCDNSDLEYELLNDK